MSAIKRFRGDTRRLGATLKKDGLVLDITGCSFILTVNKKENPTELDLPEFASIGVIIDPALGQLYFPFTAEQVNLLGDFFYDIQMTDAIGELSTLVKKPITFTQDITK